MMSCTRLTMLCYNQDWLKENCYFMSELALWSAQASGNKSSLDFRPWREIHCLEKAGILSCFKTKCLQRIQLNSNGHQTDLKQYPAIWISCCVLAIFQTLTWKK